MGCSQIKSSPVKENSRRPAPTLLDAQAQPGKPHLAAERGTLSERASSMVESAPYIIFASVSADGAPWSTRAAFWTTEKGLCFATAATSAHLANLRSNSKCSFTIFNADAPFMTGYGVQASGSACVVDASDWSGALQGIRARFDDREQTCALASCSARGQDAADMHAALFRSMGCVLVEVTVEKAYCNSFDPWHRRQTDIRWQDLKIAPFPRLPANPSSGSLVTRARVIVQNALYATFVSASSAPCEPWASAVAFWPTERGICFATPSSSSKVQNIQANSKCSFAIFDECSQYMAPLDAGAGIQAFGRAAIVDGCNDRAVLEGIRKRFPNAEDDVVELHKGVFDSMKRVLIEVVVDEVVVSCFDPEKGGDVQAKVDLAWTDFMMKPFSTSKSLGE